MLAVLLRASHHEAGKRTKQVCGACAGPQTQFTVLCTA